MRRFSAVAALSAAVLTGVMALPLGAPAVQAAPPPVAIAPGAYSLSNVFSAKQLDVAGVSVAAGAGLTQSVSRGSAAQSWWVAQVSPGVYKINSVNSGLCLQDAAAVGGTLTQAVCQDTSAQQWKIVQGDGGFTLSNVASGHVAGVADASAGAVVAQDPGTATTQQWTLAANSVSRVSVWRSALTSGGPAVADQTIRMVVHPNLAGFAQRLTLSNRFGTTPLVIGAASVGYQSSGLTASAAPTSVMFGGAATITIPAGQEAVSDPLNVEIKRGTNLLVSLYVSGSVPTSTFHNLGLASNSMAAGNHAADTAADSFTQATSSYFFLKGIDVISATSKGTMVALGDSITDGYGSTQNGFNNWPAQLADKITANDSSLAMANVGISSNRLTLDSTSSSLSRGMSAINRFSYDVAAVPGVKSVFLFEGINDIPDGVSSDQLIAGYRNVIAQARAAGLKIYGATMTPTKGVASFTADRELTRTTANQWILTSGEFDGVADFSAAVADPADPQKVLAAYDSGDHIHLNAAGYGVLAKLVDAAPFTRDYKAVATGPGAAVTAGTAAVISGSGFAAGEKVTLEGDCLAAPVTVTSTAEGVFAAAAGIDASCPAGTTTVTATGAVSRVAARATIQILAAPVVTPSATPTVTPTVEPTVAPTADPTVEPTAGPTVEPTVEPTAAPTTDPTTDPTVAPTAAPTETATTEPTVEATTEPAREPTVDPTVKPTAAQTSAPTGTPTNSTKAAVVATASSMAVEATTEAAVSRELASTGSTSTLPLMAGGALLIAGAVLVAARKRGRRA
ncbi:GDSL-type esterase/lipase family protein [Arthrobacter sp. ERGS1:01]|uniref:GDSL-type esterase/lipase family protein n=1 Tax=Arthrobacter sp. ERGS1:01 TaxID=1704044 RepID=UPI0006B42662|nr:GDSL-type esterase/lipase family protein [Arthrobacter sp. ERGS1:01]